MAVAKSLDKLSALWRYLNKLAEFDERRRPASVHYHQIPDFATAMNIKITPLDKINVLAKIKTNERSFLFWRFL
jgi:hypothetical protein